MKPADAYFSTGFLLSRSTASNTPSPTPMIIAITVPKMVPLIRPSMIGGRNRNSKVLAQSHRGLVTKECTTMATSTAMNATATQRQG